MNGIIKGINGLKIFGQTPLLSYDVGALKIPSDQLAMVHAGETIIPATFAESLRKGDISIGAGPALDAGENAQLAVVRDVLEQLAAGEKLAMRKAESSRSGITSSLRSGDLALSRVGGSGTTITYQTNVNVEGSIVSEDGLVETLATKIDRKTKRGQLERV
jgi:ABC-type taurine transport system substrate-binding protein